MRKRRMLASMPVSAMLCLMCAGIMQVSPVLAQDLVLSDGWARANPPVMPNSAAYLKIKNNGAQADRLLRVEGDIAGMLEIHQTVNKNNVMSMELLQDGLFIPAEGVVELAPGGAHIMMMGLRAPLQAGDHFSLQLHFEKSAPVTVEFEIREPGA